jgi:hypothetical protein
MNALGGSDLAQNGPLNVENGAKMGQNALFFKLIKAVNSSRINQKRRKNCPAGLFSLYAVYGPQTKYNQSLTMKLAHTAIQRKP